MKNVNNKILEAVSNAIQLALDDYDDSIKSSNSFNDVVDAKDSRASMQSHIGQKLITQKTFIYELCKRLPGVDKKIFAPFGFVNYKVTGNDSDWPYITSLNKLMAPRIREKYQAFFDIKGWTTVSSMAKFEDLILIHNDIFKNYHSYNEKELRGKDAYNKHISNEYWINEFKGKYDEFSNAIKLLAYYHPYLINALTFWIDQISLSNDGAFIAIMYDVHDAESNKSLNHVEIFSTKKLVGETGIDFNEENTIATKQKKFKSYLNKTIMTDTKLPNTFMTTLIGGHAAFSLSTKSNVDFDYRLRYWQRADHAHNVFRKQASYAKTFDALLFISYAMFNCLYIEDKYDNNVYDELKNNSSKPYIVISSKDGKYLMAFYNTYISYQEYNLMCMIIDNTDYSIMPKEYLKLIEYNVIK